MGNGHCANAVPMCIEVQAIEKAEDTARGEPRRVASVNFQGPPPGALLGDGGWVQRQPAAVEWQVLTSKCTKRELSLSVSGSFTGV